VYRRPLTPMAEAIAAVLESINVVSEVEMLPLQQANGRVLATGCISPINVPPATNSAMDGYAVCAADVQQVPVSLPVSQRIVAGDTGSPLAAGTAARIFTGAPLPTGADAVVMQENTALDGEQVSILQAPVEGENTRAAGEDIKHGQDLFLAGQRLTAQDIGVLASVGIAQLAVVRKLRVALFTTGDELVSPGTELKAGQIYNSNHYALSALLENIQAEVVMQSIVGDDFSGTQAALMSAAANADVIISTGGVSVGEEDHVKAAIESIGHIDLWKLAIKPGKPFASGKVGDVQFFGLPGNPVSAFVTFILLVKPALLTMQGCTEVFPRSLPIPAGFDAGESGERQEYIRVRLRRDEKGMPRLYPYDNQSSGAGASLSHADGLAIIPPYTAVNRGDFLEFLMFSELIY
jgi:molybdopterin molybdotransferase